MHREKLHPQTKILFEYVAEYEPIKQFHLIGGTALALHIGHRESIDLDFVYYDILSSKEKKIIKDLKPNYELTYESEEQFDCFIDDVKLSLISYWRKPLFPLHIYKNILIRDLQDIAISKAHTIGRRSEIKDYIDLYIILKEQHMDLKNIIELSEKKFGGDFSAKLFLQQLLLVDQCEKYEILMTDNYDISPTTMLSFFEQEIKKIL